jgi:hypothetical protein
MFALFSSDNIFASSVTQTRLTKEKSPYSALFNENSQKVGETTVVP